VQSESHYIFYLPVPRQFTFPHFIPKNQKVAYYLGKVAMPDRTNTNKSFQGLMGMAMHGKVLNLSRQRSRAEDNWKRVIDSTIFRQ
jgi:hypothetical protein